MTLGEKLKNQRKTNKYSQEKIAELVGVSRQAVTKWETDHSSPSTDNLIKLANIYHISLDELVNDSPTCPNDATKPVRKGNTALIIISILALVITLFILFFIITKNTLLLLLIELGILLIPISVGIYVLILLIKALNKYIHTS